ncbi:GDSL esterase/lipase At4g10955-like isoform X2 [Macadamia integrifolia]|nr:GDSL esterase/lipase At4g10955-like isoform X2 [Macadamia integrifolia]XP_042504267.1 GDSL esterase/lipase At4g10955-like isoform X2 [Macadamia integrifolia]XP_042504268.1 GDSL esterase/lipase At4g10955-like isoform X2 [Macadamia integrifolia]XP_042504269.1 GDSL esterase/lipase At4g10955-like isoform X2 [Macadamia integrifolia]XP_042504270.1 GDSL esterase/lipase At4g10955-like isoform X2 [Macadamia integrifolia]XP_042504271.1 GDSL esterase/lipase At4g10955-like isoform X2 [Macadamia integri
MTSERDIFSLSGPLHLTSVDWTNEHHRRSVAASLVQGVYVLERDRQLNRKGPESLAPPWWEFFHFQLLRQLVDNVDSSIFGAIYEFKPLPSNCHYSIQGAPRYVIAFRGTITKGESFTQDLKLDLLFIQNGLHGTPRFEIAMQAVRNMVAAAGALNIWLAGHSLGSAIAMLAGKTMAKTGVFLQAFLFNPPFVSAPIERIKDKKVKHGIRMANSFITAGLTFAIKGHHQCSASEDPFVILSAWVPCLFVNPADHICSEYVGYFEHRKKMEEIGAGGIEKLATRNSIGGLLLGKKESEPLHLLPSANLTVNLSPSPDFKRAHGIHQWWIPDLLLQCKLYQYR